MRYLYPRLALALIAVFSADGGARADDCRGKPISVDVGDHAGHLDVLPGSSGRSEATLVAFDTTGAGRQRWHSTLDFSPHISFVDAKLAWAAFVGSGFEHQLVLLNQSGEIVVDYSLLDLGLTDAERTNNGKKRKGCYEPWADSVSFSENAKGDALYIDLPSGRRLVVSAASGDLRAEAGPKPAGR